jgi:hypothetical protein
VHMQQCVFEREGVGGVGIYGSPGPLGRAGQERCFKGTGVHKNSHLQLIFSSGHPFDCSTGIMLLSLYAVSHAV